jgi:hypothetical protein
MANPYASGLDLTKSNTIASNPYLLDLGLTPEETARVQDELDNWKFYKGQHWKHKRPDGEPQVTANYVKAFVDKGVAFLAGKGFAINTEPEAEEITKPFLDDVWDDNNRELTFIEMAQMGGVTGNVFVKVAVEQFNVEEEPHMFELYPKGRIRLILLPSNCVFPRFYAHDRDKIMEVNIIYKILMDEGGRMKEYWYREHITPKTITEYLGDKVVKRRPNPLKMINVVPIKNIPVAGESLGQPDIKDIKPIQKELNEKMTDISDIINYHSAPITVIKGARASKLERGARKVWGGLPKDADVFNLELKSDLSAALNYIGILKTAMFEIGKIPENALGAKKSISNTSGVALHIENQPLMELTRTKWATYGKGIQEINTLILKFAELLDLEEFPSAEFKKLKPRLRYATTADFKDPLPKDELIQMQLIAQKIALNLQTRLDALKELGEHNAKEKLEEIKAELEEWNDMMMDMGMSMNQTANGANKALQTNIGGEISREEQADPNNKKED